MKIHFARWLRFGATPRMGLKKASSVVIKTLSYSESRLLLAASCGVYCAPVLALEWDKSREKLYP
jgi:hypothetical protein